MFYLISGLAYLAVFVWCYLRLTPYDDFKLIREGKAAAAICLSGSILGFVFPMVKAIEQSASLSELMVWALITLLVQVLTYLFIKRLCSMPSSRISCPK